MKRYKYIAIGIILILLVAGTLIFLNHSKNTTFNEIVMKDINTDEISSLQVISRLYNSADEDERSLTDKNEINKIVDYFSQLELKRTNLSNISYTESYWITIKVNRELAFGLILYDNHYINIFEYNRGRSSYYKITSKVDPPVVIQELFKK
ncbi:hypothetical protein [Paenibacillus barengoltzii]|jgi:hypothetical protein|uniref:hypothetical protein n=1 Tax=Paenibacillus barengoltzii TaxID=343517 RepID=UPI000A084A26|nr:hypothetical protein [Paenibacillus barengoltzii]MEC2342646.1 hypothetical protein [Paenibacillus barengoltzii]SMF44161.1 hypothetical protein SAMN02744102_03269 [Paenibacillus barengoltzii]